MLAFDIGNGSIKYGLFRDGALASHGRLAPDADLAPIPRDEPAAAVSVNPALLARLRAHLPGLRVIGEDVELPLAVDYDPPGDCGADRILGVAGALALRPRAPGVLLLDAGTCLTATVGLRDRGVLGGAILPGLDLMADALAAGTAQLPRVEPHLPEGPLGRSTAESIRVGLHAAVRGAARELIRDLRAAAPVPLDVVLAGTGARALGAALPEADAIEPHATLHGV
ncbi:MAG: type III pantothenate kinase, partial [Planctomycetota bacterium]|nr:type III pantothenate kinase [Planctomycetota bacterium]